MNHQQHASLSTALAALCFGAFGRIEVNLGASGDWVLCRISAVQSFA
jgi:hypothetical protein